MAKVWGWLNAAFTPLHKPYLTRGLGAQCRRGMEGVPTAAARGAAGAGATAATTRSIFFSRLGQPRVQQPQAQQVARCCGTLGAINVRLHASSL